MNSTEQNDSTIHAWFDDVLKSESAAIERAAKRAGPEVVAAIRTIGTCTGRLIVTGMGKMGCIARKAAGTFSSTGTPAIFLDPADAIHGGLGIVGADDVVLAISNSGETSEVLELIPFFIRLKLPIIAVTGGTKSSLARQSTIVIDSSVESEADPDSLVPTNSSTVALACCDALAVALIRLRGFTKEDFAIFHPGGNLGRKLLLKVVDLMHAGEQLPIATEDCSLGDAIKMISQKKMGTVIVEDNAGCLSGILTDGDVRRIFESTANSLANPLGESVAAFMSRQPAAASVDDLAATALNLMESRHISVLPVVDPDRKIVGIIHLHDLIRGGLA
ncbi:KpsF/GutQ family sugar-phosphate isomerase [Mariniblastus fucicola]|uniref:Arabinose 5-phosphate isomerase KdsD n=1 Tax=Mariniblastus fucicola TaxID=980251 RepID=A0A5B9P8I1_9BACT|nr:KpsF/GutQ family sugar-phosphate isomerase [Mariniblastus fucicola]QEG21515.1 Arabinose 5-phosphate isomerase KdsD [Mariniblastus fucicola]